MILIGERKIGKSGHQENKKGYRGFARIMAELDAD